MLERVKDLEEELARWKSMFDASRMLIGQRKVPWKVGGSISGKSGML